MKSVMITCFALASVAAFGYEEAATVRALESEFANLNSYSSIEYFEGDQSCDLYANVIASTSAGFRYECDVCLVADDNHLWDYEALECAPMRD